MASSMAQGVKDRKQGAPLAPTNDTSYQCYGAQAKDRRDSRVSEYEALEEP